MIIERKENVWEIPFSTINSGQNFETKDGYLCLKKNSSTAWVISNCSITEVSFKREDKVRPVNVRVEVSYADEI